jgi:uncharacterized protein YcbK (DUF882 family)
MSAFKNFHKIRYFSPEEFHYPEMMDSSTLQLLEAMRAGEAIRRAIIITLNADYTPPDVGGHRPDSMHYMGKAVDCVIRDATTRQPLPIIEQFLMALKWFWSGVGFYPHWNEPGLHLDTRPVTRIGARALWWRDADGCYHPVKDYFKGGTRQWE